jgi:uncharacterized protein (TIGR03083 family)
METRPRNLLLTTSGSCDFDLEYLLEVFADQRRRFMEVLAGFASDDWTAPTRCAKWTAHDIVRHLCDCNGVGAGYCAGNDEGSLDVATGFDPRVTPREWMTTSANESPETTLAHFATTTEELFGFAQARLAEGGSFDVRLPCGQMDWSACVLHVFWDSWVHERDILLPLGMDHPTSDDATFYVTGYGLFLAAAVASMFGQEVQETLRLAGHGGGIFDLNSRGRGVTLTANRTSRVGPQAAEVTDALAGRAPVATALNDPASGSLTALSVLADFFNSAVE